MGTSGKADLLFVGGNVVTAMMMMMMGLFGVEWLGWIGYVVMLAGRCNGCCCEATGVLLCGWRGGVVVELVEGDGVKVLFLLGLW